MNQYKAELTIELKKIIGDNKTIEYRNGRYVKTMSAEDLFCIAEGERLIQIAYGVPEEKSVEAAINLLRGHLWCIK